MKEVAEINLKKTLRKGVNPFKLGLAKGGEKVYVLSLCPRGPYTSGGTMIFGMITET